MRTPNAWLLLVMLFSLIFPSFPASAALPKPVKRSCEMKCCRRPEPAKVATPKCHQAAAESAISTECKCLLGSGEPDQPLDLTLVTRTAENDLSFLLSPAVPLRAEPEQVIERCDSRIETREPTESQDGHVGCWLGRAPPIALG